jgi:hypothetical protein
MALVSFEGPNDKQGNPDEYDDKRRFTNASDVFPLFQHPETEYIYMLSGREWSTATAHMSTPWRPETPCFSTAKDPRPIRAGGLADQIPGDCSKVETHSYFHKAQPSMQPPWSVPIQALEQAP